MFPCQSQILRLGRQIKKFLLTIFQQTLKLHSTQIVPNSQVPIQILHGKLQMHLVMDQLPLLLITVLVNGGNPNSTKDISSTELKYAIEASLVTVHVKRDLEEPMSLLMTNFVVKFKMELRMVNGTLLSA
jgi:hypothetical protein